ncbi:MAG: diacylglycerol kinase family protein [Salinivirgaceae bacterium]
MKNGKILFIVNPISGTGKQNEIYKALEDSLDASKFTHDIVFTEYRGHATQLSNQAQNIYSMVVAVGGDGTVNEVAKGLIGSNCCTLGIIPVGSGNGLARHLKLPMKVKDAIEIINQNKTQFIDTATINGEHFVNVAGIGFDAHIAHLFAVAKKRGPIPYAKIATYEFQRYKPVNYEVFIEGQPYHLTAFLISFANSAQFGNNAYISPHAIINDGLLDVCLMSEFPKVEAGQLAIKLFNKRLDKSRYMKIIRATHINIKTCENIKAHLDGEPVNFLKELEIKINPSSLNVIYNSNPTKLQALSTKIKNSLPDSYKNIIDKN